MWQKHCLYLIKKIEKYSQIVKYSYNLKYIYFWIFSIQIQNHTLCENTFEKEHIGFTMFMNFTVICTA